MNQRTRTLFQRWTVLSTLLIVTGYHATALAAEVKRETIEAWELYAEATEQRIAKELQSDDGFLVRDFEPGSEGVRANLLAGQIAITKLRSANAAGTSIAVPKGLIHHWLGSVFIPGATVEQILQRISNPGAPDLQRQDVLESRVLARGPNSLKLFLKLQRKQFVTVVYNTEHVVQFASHGAGRASSRSIATKIAELENAQTVNEWEKPEGQDRGFLWRLNSYWRYQQVDGGVIVECESISLSRSIPSVLRVIVRPLINSVAKGAMERTLVLVRDQHTTAPRHRSRNAYDSPTPGRTEGS